jgi:polysaccharide lyase-like protein
MRPAHLFNTRTRRISALLGGALILVVSASAWAELNGAPQGLIWNGALLRPTLASWGYVQACPGPSPPSGVSVVRQPIPPGQRYAIRFTVSDASVNVNCPILGSPGNPNAQVLSPNIFRPGDNVYVSFSLMLPPGFPRVPFEHGSFFSLMEVYGEPFDGSPPFALLVTGRHLFLGTRVSADAWNSPEIRYGQWMDFVLHVNFATDDSGYVQLWYDSVQQRFSNGSETLHEPTLLPGVDWNGSSPDHLSLQQYRAAFPPLGTVVSYASGAEVGTSYSAVAPNLGPVAP